ncbi:MAG: RNA 2',3'-cyclic phosphodiesterase [Thermoguttaceae bacterium]|jgi:2'-5' RNA ligase
MSTVRTFIAIEIDAAVRARAAELIGVLRAAEADVKWVEPQNLHITLQFLGEVPEEQIAAVCQAVEQGAAHMPPFDLEIRWAGAFPNANRPRTLWIGANAGSDRMADLHDNVALELSELGFQDEDRKFQTHLTIGRTRSGKNAAELGRLLKQHADFDAGCMRVEKVTVFSSRLERGGPLYDVLSTARLSGT